MVEHSSPVTDDLYARYVEILGRLQSAWADNGGNAKINNEDLLILEQAGGRVRHPAQGAPNVARMEAALTAYRAAQKWATGTDKHRLAIQAADEINPMPRTSTERP